MAMISVDFETNKIQSITVTMDRVGLLRRLGLSFDGRRGEGRGGEGRRRRRGEEKTKAQTNSSLICYPNPTLICSSLPPPPPPSGWTTGLAPTNLVSGKAKERADSVAVTANFAAEVKKKGKEKGSQ